MTAYTLTLFLAGSIFAGYGVIGLFFWRFWTKSKDRLFAYFATAFWLLAVERVTMLRFGHTGPHQWAVYLIRLCAFVLIIAAIVEKNRPLATPPNLRR